MRGVLGFLFFLLMGLGCSAQSGPLGANSAMESVGILAREIQLYIVLLNKGTSFPTGFEQYQKETPLPSYSLPTLRKALDDWKVRAKAEVPPDQLSLEALETERQLLVGIEKLDSLKLAGGGTWDRSPKNAEYNVLVQRNNQWLQKLGPQLGGLKKEADARAARRGKQQALGWAFGLLVLLALGKGFNLANSGSPRNYWRAGFYYCLISMPWLALSSCAGLGQQAGMHAVDSQMAATLCFVGLFFTKLMSMFFAGSQQRA